MHILHAALALARRYHEIFLLFLYVIVPVKAYPALAIKLPLNQWLDERRRLLHYQFLLMRHLDSFDSEHESTDPYDVFFVDLEFFLVRDPQSRQGSDLKLVELRSEGEQLLDLLLILELTQRILAVYRLILKPDPHYGG